MKSWLIGYDIANPKRLGKIHRLMIAYATPIEYSIFLFTGTEQTLTRCLNSAKKLIDQKKDDLRCYPLPLRGLQERIGAATLPEGIIWTALPAEFID